MKIFRFIITITGLLCLNFDSSGQYCLLKRNQVNPFDTAVAVEILEYRKIRTSSIVADSLIRSLRTEIDTLNIFIINLEASRELLMQVNERHEATILDKDNTIKGLRHDFMELHTQCSRIKRAWYDSRGFYFGSGVVVSIGFIFVVTQIVK
jgi:hypothetical protein